MTYKHNKLLIINFVAFIIFANFISGCAIEPMIKIPKKPQYYRNGVGYFSDYVSYDAYFYWGHKVWNRNTTLILDEMTDKTMEEIPEVVKNYRTNFLAGKIDSALQHPVLYGEEVVKYERADLVYYVGSVCPRTNTFRCYGYDRKSESKFLITDKEIEKPYVRIGTFTVSGKTPPNWKKVKDAIRSIAKFSFSAEAVIVENVETHKFKQEDFLPITMFQYPEYVVYKCVAVVYKENAFIPKNEKVLFYSTHDIDFTFPHEVIDEFYIDNEIFTDSYATIKKTAYDKYKADGVRVLSEEDIKKPGFFSSGITRYHCKAIRFDEKIKQQLIIYPDTDINEFRKRKLQY